MTYGTYRALSEVFTDDFLKKWTVFCISIVTVFLVAIILLVIIKGAV